MRVLTAAAVSLVVFASNQGSQPITITRSGSQPTINGPRENFTGTARIVRLIRPNDPARTSVSNVTFEPGGRTAWHTHPLGQILVVTTGTGWVQGWGGRVEEIRQGDVVWTPPGVKHWHGATRATGMTHLAIVESIEGQVVQWMEQVSEQQYRSESR